MSLRLLIVDDQLIMRMRIKEIAQAAGWEIVGEASNGKDAVERFRELRPDLVTMDIVMPELDGIEALRQIRQIDPGARVAMVSAINQADKLSECIRLGAVDFIVKPFKPARLHEFLDKQGRVPAAPPSSSRT